MGYLRNMTRGRIEEASRRWVENSIRANPDRIRGIVEAYYRGKQSLNWASRLLKKEDGNLVMTILNTFQSVDAEKRRSLIEALY